MKLEILHKTELFNISEEHMEYFNYMEDQNYIRWSYVHNSNSENDYNNISLRLTPIDAHPMTIQIFIDTVNLYVPKRKKFQYTIY